MALPTSYSEETLAQFMQTALGDVATALGWSNTTPGGDYAEPVNETLVAMGVSDVTTVTGLAALGKLRAFARVMVWRAAVDSLAARHDFSADGGSYSRSQLNSMAADSLKRAETQAMAYGLGGYQVTVGRMQNRHDPYTYWPPDERTRP